MLKERMEFLLDIQVMLQSHDFDNYLELRNWPRSFRHWLNERKIELQSAKSDLFSEMGKERQEVLDKIDYFKRTITALKGQGLIKENEEAASDRLTPTVSARSKKDK